MDEIYLLLNKFQKKFENDNINIKRNFKDIKSYFEKTSLKYMEYFTYISKFINNFGKTNNDLNLLKNDINLLNILQQYINEIIKFQTQIILLFSNKIMDEFSKLQNQIETTFFSSKLFNKLPYSIQTKDKITCLFLLPNDDFIAALNNSNMIIYDKDKLIEKLKINEFRYEIKSLIQIKNKNIIASSEKEIKIFKFYENNTKYEILNILKGHNSSINKVIELKNENLISCSSDCSIIIWKKMNKENDYNKQIEVLNEENGPIYSLLEIDDKIVSLHNENDYAIIWNYEIMEKIKFIYDIELNLFSNIFLFTERNNIIISGKGIYIINTKNFEITHRYYSKNYEHSCLFKIDSNSFLIGKNKIYSNESSSSIEQWDFNKEKNEWIIEKKIDTIYQDEINVLIYIKNQKKIMSSSDNSKIHFYQ